jgi:predicted DNA-binding WGR domain protein
MFVRLENTNGHNKFYEMYGYAYQNVKTKIDEDICITIKYGIINCEGKAIFKHFKDIADLWDFYRKKIQEKLDKDYLIVKSDEK